jgi:GDP-mannose 6-dehydrogenase
LRLSVFGIGYVGTVVAACLARDGHSVCAVDINQDKVDALARGRSPVIEPRLQALVEHGRRSGRLTATSDPALAVSQSDMSLVCVGTPGLPDGSPDRSHLLRAVEQLGSLLAAKPAFHSVVVRSTVLPGTTEELVIPLLEKMSGKRAGIDFGVGYLPEFLREGSAIADHDDPGTLVLAALDARTRSLLAAILAPLPLRPAIVDIRTAETVKYVSNAWHALKVSFANEVGRISQALAVDSFDVMDIICADQKMNMSPAYLRPGFAFGGSCLPKDIDALRHLARSMDVVTPVLDGLVESNALQFEQAVAMIEATGRRRIGIVGLSFKPGIDDLRSSPLVSLAERLLGKGYSVRIFDPVVRVSQLTGANAAFLAGRLPRIREMLHETPAEVIAHSDVVVVADAEAGQGLLPDLLQRGIVVIDLVRMSRDRRSDGAYRGLSW